MPPEPFSWITARARPRVLAVVAVGVVALSAWLTTLSAPLATDAAPSGIVSFELARTGARTAEILGSWVPEARDAALLVQGIDFLYLLVYPAFFSLAATLLGARLEGRWQWAGRAVAWGVLAAIPLDMVENLALITELRHGASDGLARLAWACAVAKFALVGTAALFLFAGASAWLARRARVA